MQSAAGGTSHRLKPALATMRSRSRIPVPTAPAVAPIVDIYPPIGTQSGTFHSASFSTRKWKGIGAFAFESTINSYAAIEQNYGIIVIIYAFEIHTIIHSRFHALDVFFFSAVEKWNHASDF